MILPEHKEPPSNYAAFTTRLNSSINDLGWAIRDNKYQQAHQLLAEIMNCSAELHRYITKCQQQQR